MKTVKAWISDLEGTYQIVVLQPYFANVDKRLVKIPKIYFTDGGTLCYLTDLKDPGPCGRRAHGGAIMESAVLSEIVKTLAQRSIEPQVCF